MTGIKNLIAQEILHKDSDKTVIQTLISDFYRTKNFVLYSSLSIFAKNRQHIILYGEVTSDTLRALHLFGVDACAGSRACRASH